MSSAQTLHQAVVHLDLVKVKSILEGPEGWKVINNDGETVLHQVFKYTNTSLSKQKIIIEILKCFLDEGLSVDLKNAAGQTVLFSAVRNRLRHVIDFLLQHGAKLNSTDQNGNTIIHFLVDDQFEKYGENLTFREVIKQDQTAFMAWLLSKGASVDIQNYKKKTALHLAIEHNLQHIMPILIAHMKNVNLSDKDGCTVIESFLKRKASRNIREASNMRDHRWDSRLFDFSIVQGLLKKGASVDHINNEGNTIIHTFLKSPNPNLEIIRCMLQRYTSVNAQDSDGNTALHLVVTKSFAVFGWCRDAVDFVRILVAKGADLCLKNKLGETAVRQAFWIRNFDCLKVMLDYNAGLNPPEDLGGLLLHDICFTPSIDDDLWAPMVDILVRAGWNVNAISHNDHFTPLLEACRCSRPAIAQRLIENGANVNYVEKENLMRPVHLVGSSEINQDANSAALLKMLVKAGADVNVKNKRGQTPLHLASHRDYDLMNTLLKLGGDVDASDNEGRLPLHEAFIKRNTAGIRALLKFGANINDDGMLEDLKDFAIQAIYGEVEAQQFDIVFHRTTAELLTQHWLKLKAANLPAIAGFTDFAKKESLQEFYAVCLKEAEQLKKHHLNGQFTLYDLLHMDVCVKHTLIAKNEKLKELVESPQLAIRFPKYHSLIKACYHKAVARGPLVEPAERVLYGLTGLPYLCLMKIIELLKNDNLRVMTEVKEKLNSLKRSSSHMFHGKSTKKKRLE